MSWANDRQRDRKKGTEAEYSFKNLLENYGYRVQLTQEGLNKAYKIQGYIGGDAFVYYNDKPIAHVEIKQKYPTYDGYFGIELYRLSDYLKIQELLNVPVYYVINVSAGNERGMRNIRRYNLKNNSWIFERFDILWKNLKKGFILKENYYNNKGHYKFKNDKILDFIKHVREMDDRIYVEYDEIKDYLEPAFQPSSYGKIILYDKSYYRGNFGETATLVYFKTSWFKSISKMIKK
jgi:hypothetical protein